MDDLPLAVEAATSDILGGRVDWGKNLEICDAVSSNPRAEAPRLVAAVEKRLRSKDGLIQALALTLIETCVKNCGREVHERVATRDFLTTVSAVAETSAVDSTREAALALIQQWGIAFDGALRSDFPAFTETYTALKVKGLAFPEPSEADVPVFMPPSASRSSDETRAMNKLRADLDVVAEKVNLCNEMVPLSPGIDQDEALAEVVGFLEACRPRMVALIEAGSRGILSDDVLATALRVNDELGKALDYEVQHAQGGARQAPPAQLPAQPAPLDKLNIDDEDEDDDDDLALSRGTKRTASSDLLGLDDFDQQHQPQPPPQAHESPFQRQDFLS